MTETRATYALPMLAEELPTAELSIDLIPATGGTLTFATTAAYVIQLLREGIADLADGDLTRIAELYRATVEEVRSRANG